MAGLEEYDSAELLHELSRRGFKGSEPPEPKEDIDWNKVLNFAKGYVSFLHKNGYEQKDGEHYIYEAVLTAIYGKEIWTWINKKLK